MPTIDTRSTDELVASVKRIERLLFILTRQAFRETISAVLADEKARSVYELTGQKSVREIAEATGLGLGTISKYWTQWEALGLLVKEGQRYRKMFDDETVAVGDQKRAGRRRPAANAEQTTDIAVSQMPQSDGASIVDTAKNGADLFGQPDVEERK